MNKKTFLFVISLIFVFKVIAQDEVISYSWELNSLDKIGDNNVTVLGDPQVIETDKGTAIQFDGDGDMLLVDANPIGDAKEFTVEVIFKPDAGINKTNEPRFIHIQDPDDLEAKRVMIELRVNEQDEMYLDGFILTDKENLTLIDENKTHNTGEWIHAAITYKNDEFSTYINYEKELSGKVEYTSKIVNETGKTSIGARMNEKNWYSGIIKTLKITHKALSTSEFMPVDPVSIPVNYFNNISIFYNYYNKNIHINNIPVFKNNIYVEIFDITGQVLYSDIISGNDAGSEYDVKMNFVRNGIYIARLKNNKDVFSKTFIIKK